MSTTFDRPWYLAGPMTGYPQFNVPKFDEVANALRERGLEIISPVELDSEAVRKAAWESVDGSLEEDGTIAGETWGEILGRDVQVVADRAGGVVLLGKWWESKGARLEVFTALQCGKPVAEYAPSEWLGMYPLRPQDCMMAIQRGMGL